MASPTSNPDLETIRENSSHREQSASPEPVAAHTQVTDFVSRVPERRSTHPAVPLSSQLKSSTGDITSSKFQRAPTRPISTTSRANFHVHKPFSLYRFRRTKSHDSEGSGPDTNFKRRSTINTNASAPFEETEVWDHKAILSLGMNRYIHPIERGEDEENQKHLNPSSNIFVFGGRWRRHPWLLGPINSPSPNESHRRAGK